MCIGIIIFILHVNVYTNYKRQIIMSLLVIFDFIVNHALIDNLSSNCSSTRVKVNYHHTCVILCKL